MHSLKLIHSFNYSLAHQLIHQTDVRTHSISMHKQQSRTQATNSDDRMGKFGKVVYQLESVTKKLDSGRTLFSNVNLAFFQGAKIGILGINGEVSCNIAAAYIHMLSVDIKSSHQQQKIICGCVVYVLCVCVWGGGGGD